MVDSREFCKKLSYKTKPNMVDVINFSNIKLNLSFQALIDINGDPWFKGVDVAKKLGYADPRNVIFRRVPDD